METRKEQFCKSCRGRTEWEIMRHYTASAVLVISWRCTVCGSRNGNPSISHVALHEQGIDIWKDLNTWTDDLHFETCDVCGAVGAEWQHWAPKKIFGHEADKWPSSYLCRKHHAEWHRKVTGDLMADNVRTFEELLDLDQDLREWYQDQGEDQNVDPTRLEFEAFF